MKSCIDLEKITKVFSNFISDYVSFSAESYGNGHINDTYKLSVAKDGKEELYLLQRMNKNVFKNPPALMENMVGVTDFLRSKVESCGGDAAREVMSVYRTKSGELYHLDADGEYWRLVTFVTKSRSYDKVERPEQFYASALAFGNFPKLLSDYPAETLYETIKDFHNTPVRYANLMRAVENDPKGRVKDVLPEIEFAKARRDFTETLENARRDGKLPLRVTHNDTKLNNVLFDIDTDEPVCVVDLDTIMPGYSVNDFGDSIRFGASTALEDEKDLDKVEMSLELYELYLKGFLLGTGGALTEAEAALMPVGAKMMTLECGMRFLTDYIEGDTYFKTAYPEHNLVRARNQFKLVADMEKKFDKMCEIVNKYYNK